MHASNWAQLTVRTREEKQMQVDWKCIRLGAETVLKYFSSETLKIPPRFLVIGGMGLWEQDFAVLGII